MDHKILFCVYLTTISIALAENIEISTPVSIDNPLTFNPNTETASEKKGKSIESNGDVAMKPQTEIHGYIAQPMYPVYPAGGYFYPGINPNNALAPVNTAVQNGSTYFSVVMPAAMMGFEILRKIFLYYLVRHFVNKMIQILDIVLDIRVTDELSYFLTKAALQAFFKVFTKLSLYIVSGAGLLAIGGLFTTIVCYLTPICTITFTGFDLQKALNKESMRSLMTPEKIAYAAAAVQDAMGKYQRLQRAVGQ